MYEIKDISRYNYTYYEPILIYKPINNKLNPIFLIISIGLLIYTLLDIYHIDIDIIIQNRFYKNVFNMILLYSSLVGIIIIIYVNYILDIMNDIKIIIY